MKYLQKLYKYRSLTEDSFERVSEIIVDGKLYCSDWKNFNDPMEGFFSSRELPNLEKIDDIINQKNAFKICSLSKSPNDILMWSHYANNHTGICIEISFKNFIYNTETNRYSNNETDVFIKKVQYEKSLGDLLLDVNQGGEELGTKSVAETILSRKIDKWKNEEEYRIFYESEQQKSIKIGEITRVIMGVRINHKLIRRLKEQSSDLNFIESQIDYRKNIVVPKNH